ncbi:MAG TPA: phosphatidylglycerol lysyltransferase domain-containing protein [Ktedonosporobacter sp.]|nr:phosphatidylglycerol lysyltransferase domain-containing protein [Ktedonosporobacter sp.]
MKKEAPCTRFLHTGRVRPTIRYSIGLITALVGLADMLSAIVPKLNWDILLGAWPIVVHKPYAQTLTVVVGFFLIMLSYGLARGKSHAWRITLVLLLLSAVLHIQRAGSVLATIVALLLAIALYVLSRFFRAKSDPPSVWRGYIVLFLGLGIVTFYAIGGFLALYNQFEPLIDHIGIDGVVLRLLTFMHLRSLPHNTQAFFFGEAFPVLCISAVVYGMIQLFRPVAAVLLPDNEERQRVKTLLRLYGKNSISYFALEEDKSYFFTGKSVISYVLEGSTAVVAGDPIGPEHETEAVIKAFVTFCAEQDWAIVFWQVRSEIADLYRQMGLHLLKIGEDAIINTQTFTLKGGAIANVRTSAKRAEKEGLRVVFYRSQVTDPSAIIQMERISHQWLKGRAEMGFSMGRFKPHEESEQLYALAMDDVGKVHAFVSFVPIYGRSGWGLDLMRRAEQSAPGTMELLLARTIEYIKNAGSEMVSLGLAPLSNANDENESFLENSIDSLTYRFGNPSKNQSLFNFKKKFQPTWESRYLVYSDPLNLPRIGWAIYHAHHHDASPLGTLRTSLEEWRTNRQECHTRTGQLETLRA